MMRNVVAVLLFVGMLLMCHCSDLLAQDETEHIAASELDRFIAQVPAFVRWARAQGLAFDVYPRPRDVLQPRLEASSRAAIQAAGWIPERFLFLLCVTGAASLSDTPSCARPLTCEERTLLRGRLPELMDAYGTGP